MEQVLNKPLSGEEVKQIILQKVQAALDSDNRLSNFFAFPSFSFHADLTIMLPGAAHDQIDKSVGGTTGSMTDAQADSATIVTSRAETGQMPPNEARMDAGLGVPVATHDEQGRPVEKTVKYAKDTKRRA